MDTACNMDLLTTYFTHRAKDNTQIIPTNTTNSWIWQTTRKVIDSLTISELQGRRKEEPLRSLRKCGYVDRLRGILGAPFSLSRPQVEHELIKPWDIFFKAHAEQSKWFVPGWGQLNCQDSRVCHRLMVYFYPTTKDIICPNHLGRPRVDPKHIHEKSILGSSWRGLVSGALWLCPLS